MAQRAIECGALWKAKTQKGEAFYAGDLNLVIGEFRILVFKNKKTENPKAPAYRVFISKATPKMAAKDVDADAGVEDEL